MGLQGQNFTIWKGDDRLIVFTIDDVQNLTGYSAEWNVAVDPDSTKLITKTSGNGIAFDGNKVNVTLNSAETNQNATNIPAGQYYHELQLVDPQGKKIVSATGIMTVLNPAKKRT